MIMSIAKIGTKCLIKKDYQKEVIEQLKADRKAQKDEKKESRR